MLRRTHCVTRDLKIMITGQECSLLLWVPGLSQERVVCVCGFFYLCIYLFIFYMNLNFV